MEVGRICSGRDLTLDCRQALFQGAFAHPALSKWYVPYPRGGSREPPGASPWTASPPSFRLCDRPGAAPMVGFRTEEGATQRSRGRTLSGSTVSREHLHRPQPPGDKGRFRRPDISGGTAQDYLPLACCQIQHWRKSHRPGQEVTGGLFSPSAGATSTCEFAARRDTVHVRNTASSK